jgi:signal peptidase II
VRAGSAGAWGRAALVAAAVVALDQVVKALVRGSVEVGERRDLVAFLDLVHVRNRGVAFSALEGQTALVVTVIAVAMAALLWYFARHAGRPLMWLPTGLLVGGAVGNLVDRIRLGAVTDFLKLPSWPAFNVADMAITVGVVGLLVVVELGERADRRAAEKGRADAAARGT